MGKYLDRLATLDSGNTPTCPAIKTVKRSFDGKDGALGRHFPENDDPSDSKDSSLTGRFSESEEATPHRRWLIDGADTTFSPPQTLAAIRGWYPDAAVAPIADDL